MSDEKVIFGLDLDNKDFVSGINSAKDSLESLGKGGGISSLVGQFKGLAGILAAVGVAILAAKKALDFTREAEEINRVEKQFGSLAESAGVSAEKLKDGMTAAAGGVIDVTNLLGIANKAFISLGKEAARLPEVIEISRKATQIYGGTAEEVTSKITQALAMQQERQLKQYGILVDTNKAYKEYAASIGVAANQLSEEGKRRAFINAALDSAKNRYRSVEIESNNVNFSIQRASVAWNEAYEAFTKFFTKTTPIWVKIFGNVEHYGNLVRKIFQDDADQTLDDHQDKLTELQVKWVELDSEIDQINKRADKALTESIATRIRGSAAELEAERNSVMEQIKLQQELIAKKAEAGKTETKEGQTSEDSIDYEKKRQDEAKFNADLIAMRQERLTKQQDMAMSAEEADRLMSQRKTLLIQEEAAREEEIKANQNLNDQQRNQLIVESKRDLNQKLAQLEDEREENHKKAEDNMVRKSESASTGMANAFNQMSRSNERALKNWGHTGQIVANSFANNMTSAIQKWADGTATASEAIKGFVFGMIADTAEAKGREMLLASIYPPNPAGMAGGAGLIALAAVLRAKSSAAKSNFEAGAGAGGGATAPVPETPSMEKPEVEAEAMKKRTVTVNIQGNVLGNTEFQREIVEMIRREGDATDFRYFQVAG